ncbi:MAG: YeeE/YedE family protein, partial [Cyclobacteriaceae bacterium]|nr:YeeE/YedE family protein [Cyclobacteriaceae bacterium]
MIDVIKEPWPWYIAGPLISSIMFILLYFNKTFGISSSFETLCTISGAGRISSFFKTEWKSRIWNLVFAVGALIGG